MYGVFFFFQAEDGIRDLVRSRGLGDVYKRQILMHDGAHEVVLSPDETKLLVRYSYKNKPWDLYTCLLYTSDAADERSSVDLGGRRIIKKKNSARDDGW